jgi:hypothetical protein
LSGAALNPIFTCRGGASIAPYIVAMNANANTRTAAARAFVRSLNILLKFARMYDFGHPRTKKQYDTAWSELQSALGSDNEAGVLLSVSGDQLLLDGMALESAAAEKSFARMLSGAGIASIHFSPKVTQASLARFTRGFPTGTGAKPAQLVEQLKAALQGDPHIHVNEVCFVPADSAIAKSSMAAHITARTLGMDSAAANELFNDPEKLLQLIVAAEGTKGSGGPGSGRGGPGGGGPGGGGSGSGAGSGGWGDGGSGQGGPGNGGPGYGEGLGPGPGGAGSGFQTGGYGPGGNAANDGSYGGAAVSGAVSPVGGTGAGSGADAGTWNIVGGSGGSGAQLDPNAGGFWLNKDGASAAGSGGGTGADVSGAFSNVGAAGGAGNSGGNGGEAGSWNIVGGSGDSGAQLDPNAGGFWLNKSGASGEGTGSGTRGGVPGAVPVTGAPVGSGGAGSGSHSADSGTWNIVGGSGQGNPIDPNAGGFWLNNDSAGTGGSHGGGSGGRPFGGSASHGGPGGHGGGDFGSGSGRSASGGNAGGFSGGPGAGSGVGGGSSMRIWRVPPGASTSPDAGAPGRWANATSGIRVGRASRAASGPGSMAVETGLMSLQEDELQGILQVLAQIARTGDATKDKLDPNAFQSRLSTLPRRARFTISQALSALAAQAPSESSDKPTLMKLAEHIAIRFALESYERGDIEVNSVRQLLDEMNTELDGLRKIMGVYEEKMTRAGIEVQSHVEMLAQQFWNEVKDDKKKAVLESGDAWCVPAAKVREYVEGLQARGESEPAIAVLRNYANCITNKENQPRRQAAMGLAELAGTYARTDERLLMDVIRQIGVQLTEERDSEMQSLVGAAFVRMSQEATKIRSYAAIQRSVELIDYVEAERPGVGKNLRPRIAIESRLPEFIDEALKTGQVQSGFADLLRRMPEPASEQLAIRFSRAGFREDCELLVSMANMLGPQGLDHLRKQLQSGSPHEAIDTVGILARIDLDMLEKVLPDRMKEWKRTAHDRVVRQISASGANERGRLLLQIFDSLDALIRPLAIDEIGMSGEQTADMRLLRLAEGDLPSGGTEYLRLKAIEALGRLRTAGAEAVLRKVSEARKAWRWANPSELRVVATQAMEKIDPEWVRSFIPKSGLSVAEFSIEPLDADPESSAIRQRRYVRLRLEHPVGATTTSLKDNCHLEIPEMTLGGGIAVCEQSLHPGSIVGVKLNTASKSVKAQMIVRDANTQARAFEVVDMDLEERAKLRRLLVQLGNAQKQSTPKERNRRSTRTILSTPV